MNISDIVKVIPEFECIKEGQDVSDILGIVKWELPSSMGSFQTKGNFPSFIPKTDQERVQNLTKKFSEIKTLRWEVTEKYDGSSMTVYVYHSKKPSRNIRNICLLCSFPILTCCVYLVYSPDMFNWYLQLLCLFSIFTVCVYMPCLYTIITSLLAGNNHQEGVCSRNLDLKKESDKDGSINSFWEIAIREKLIEKIRVSGMNLAIQGELVGNKIGPNIYKLTDRNFWLFDIYDIDARRYFSPSERQAFAEKYGIKHVPVLFNDFKIPEEYTIDELLTFAEGKSILNPKTEREGLVFKNTVQDSKINSFKTISNNYLMKVGY